MLKWINFSGQQDKQKPIFNCRKAKARSVIGPANYFERLTKKFFSFSMSSMEMLTNLTPVR